MNPQHNNTSTTAATTQAANTLSKIALLRLIDAGAAVSHIIDTYEEENDHHARIITEMAWSVRQHLTEAQDLLLILTESEQRLLDGTVERVEAYSGDTFAELDGDTTAASCATSNSVAL